MSIQVASVPAEKRAVRKQVSRACDWCRTRRVKCDLARPCTACQKSGVTCADERSESPRSLPQALREIERLRERIRHLEAELAEAGEVDTGNADPPRALSHTGIVISTKAKVSTVTQTVGRWEGISVATARSEQTSYYGPSSMQYFLSRVGTFLGSAFAEPVPTRNMLLTGVNRRLAYLTSSGPSGPSADPQLPASSGIAKVHQPAMSRTQEEYFLNTFWESYYYTLPIVDEDAFQAHYASLWESPDQDSRGPRKDSALVDIILALCIQSSSSFLPLATTGSTSTKGEDPTIAGRWYYRRAKALLAAYMESPSITTVQVQLLASIYLCCASFQNTSHSTLAVAVRNATIVGLHREPPPHLPLSERELRKRIWWTLWTMDTKMCMKLGRPFDVDSMGDSSISLPIDSLQVASSSVLHDPSLVMSAPGHFTWLTYDVHVRTIVSTAADIHRTIHSLYDKVLSAHDPPLSSPYRHPAVLEQCAHVLSSHVAPFHALPSQIPSILLLPRGNGTDLEPFSFDCSSVRLDESIPVWLQGQRLYLELTYHSMAVALYRPFISFYQRGVGSKGFHRYMPATERHAARCVRHAIVFVKLFHKVVQNTTLLAPGWDEYFQWLWNAAVTLAGFLLAHPLHASTKAAREASECAAVVCDVYAAAGFVVAADAATILRCLLVKVDALFAQVAGISGPLLPAERTTLETGVLTPAETMSASLTGDAVAVEALPEMGDSISWLDPQQPDNPENFSMFMDWALAVDSFNSFDQLLGPVEWDGLKW